MSFFNSLYNSLYNFKWLRQQKDNSPWAWGYFFLLIFFVSGLVIIPNAFHYFQSAPGWKTQLAQELPEFQANLTNGNLQVTGPAQPFVKTYNQMVLVVDTMSTTTAGVKSFLKNDNQVGVMVTKDHVEYYNPQDQQVQSTQMFGPGNDMSFGRGDVLTVMNDMLSTKMLTIFTAVFFVLLLIFYTLSNLLNVFFFSLLFYQMSKRRKLGYKFKQIFTVGLFAVTMPLVVGEALPAIPYLGWIWAVLVGVWMYLALFKNDEAKV